jgi:hypothetical protein
LRVAPAFYMSSRDLSRNNAVTPCDQGDVSLFDPDAKEAHYQRKWTTFSTKPEIASNDGDKDHNERAGHVYWEPKLPR